MKRRMLMLFIAMIISAFVTGTRAAMIDSRQEQKQTEDCGLEVKKTPTDVVATVNGVKITIKDVEDPIKDEIANLQNQVVRARSRELGLHINSRLLTIEDEKKGTTPTKLIEQEVLAKTKEPTEAEAQAYYDQNRGGIQGNFKDLKQKIIDYLRMQRQGEEAQRFADKLKAAADVKVFEATATAPAKESDHAKVLAKINGVNITSGDVEDALKPLIYDIQQQVYGLKKMEMEVRINDMLLEQEAQKRKMTARALIEAEVTPKIKKVSEVEAKKFYDENRESINGDFAQLKDQIIDYLQKKEQQKAEHVFAEQLRRVARIEINRE